MRRYWLVFSQAVTVLLAAYFVVMTMKPEWLSNRPVTTGASGITLSEAPTAATAPPPAGSFRQAAQRASQAVVSINTSKAAERPSSSDPWFRFFFGDQGALPQSGLGSGVIISPDGFILTNNHVVEGATEIEVALNDSRRARAKVIGTDPETDLAILKITLDRLPVITLGNSDALQVGDQVLAIGNPFGVGQTVTSGIVSALGRNQLGINTFENFIQTDAAINPGYSGGALVDANGNLIGINTAIFSKSGGSQGIGFAIPVKLALEVMKSIIEHGQVIRGWLGIEVQPLSQELAESFGMKDRPGIVVAGIFREGPAAKAGLQLGDVILSINGEPAGDGRKSMNQVARIKPNEKITIEVMRNGQQLKLIAEVGLRPPPAPAVAKEEK